MMALTDMYHEFVPNTKAHEVHRSYTLYFWLIVDIDNTCFRKRIHKSSHYSYIFI